MIQLFRTPPPPPERLTVINEHFYAVADALQLPPAARARAERLYLLIGAYLQEEAPSFASTNASMYSQGSMRHRTTTLPLFRDVFDLDAVSELGIDFHYLEPVSLIDGMHRELVGWVDKCGKEHGAKPPIRKNRCTELSFTGEIFTIDIVAAGKNTAKPDGFIKIPDRDLSGWKDTNPKGLGTWYDARCATQLQMQECAEGRALSSVEPLKPDLPTANKPVLTLVTQLIKRGRDRFHREKPEMATPSILITVLVAERYQGVNDLAIALLMASEDLLQIAASARPPEVRNPANADEVISEKWQNVPGAWEAFRRFATDFNRRIREMFAAEDLVTLRALLKDTFGDRAVEDGVRRLSRAIDVAHQQGRQPVLGTGRIAAAVSTAALVTPACASGTGIIARPTTYHGD